MNPCSDVQFMRGTHGRGKEARKFRFGAHVHFSAPRHREKKFGEFGSGHMRPFQRAKASGKRSSGRHMSGEPQSLSLSLEGKTLLRKHNLGGGEILSGRVGFRTFSGSTSLFHRNSGRFWPEFRMFAARAPPGRAPRHNSDFVSFSYRISDLASQNSYTSLSFSLSLSLSLSLPLKDCFHCVLSSPLPLFLSFFCPFLLFAASLFFFLLFFCTCAGFICVDID